MSVTRLAVAGASRFDVAIDARFPVVSPSRLARQIRQDMWRALQDQRAFKPLIEVTEAAEGLTVRAGGQIDARHPKAHLEAKLHDLFDANRARWIRHAGRGLRATRSAA